MVPSSFSVVTEIPKTATGKNDRRALARLETEAPSQKGQDKPEKLTVEQQVVKIWQEVLDRKQLDLYASFFDQGGTSLAALTVLSRLFPVELEHDPGTVLRARRNPGADSHTEGRGFGTNGKSPRSVRTDSLNARKSDA